jgi:hypothetical protein
VTPQEVIEARMLELWGKRNLARLERESDVPRESLSKILGYKRGLGPEVAAKVAGALSLDVADLLPPAEEAVTMVSLDRRLQSLEAQVRDSGKQTARAIRALTRATERLERQLTDEAPPAKTAAR